MPYVENVDEPEVGQLIHFDDGSPNYKGPFEVVEPGKSVKNIHTRKVIPWPEGQPCIVTPKS